MKRIEYDVVVVKNGEVTAEVERVTGHLVCAALGTPLFAVRKDKAAKDWKVDHVPTGRWGFIAPSKDLAVQVAREMEKIATDDIVSADARKAGAAFPEGLGSWFARVKRDGFVTWKDWNAKG